MLNPNALDSKYGLLEVFADAIHTLDKEVRRYNDVLEDFTEYPFSYIKDCSNPTWTLTVAVTMSQKLLSLAKAR